MYWSVVLDTNCVISSVSRFSPKRILLDKLFEQQFEAVISSDILLEYEEKVSEKFNDEIAEEFISALIMLPNLKKIETYFRFSLIERDPDDNKFVDCAFAANVHWLVTNDRHFNILKAIEFPKINIISLEEFIKLLDD
ncbi:MAG TPA: putative toxin-antitoxin system toxin component, PIN family [Chitinophagales bacterium]|nr:putative toxin-antitoxin system toxin component, PIN family [Chitinophagales bacterium]